MVRKVYQYLRNRAYRLLIYPLYPWTAPVEKPVFIVGCGRSGTTVLGRLIQSHPQLAYLNEAGHIWHYNPQVDIWGPKSAQRKGKLSLTAADLSPRVAERVHRAFAVELHRQGGDYIVEKTPVNSFRIDYLLGIFPDARFIHMLRNGVEVAHSIAVGVHAGTWHKGRKWELLVDHARTQGKGHLSELCQSGIDRGLLEWRLFVTAARRNLSQIPPHRCLEIRYRDLIAAPHTACTQIETFIGVDTSQEMRQFAAEQIRRRSPQRDLTDLSRRQRQIGGELLTEVDARSQPTPHP